MKQIQPTRVMTSPDFAAPPARARGQQIDLIFVRADGWELGTSMHFVFWAHRTWADQWTYVLVRVGKDEWQRLSILEWRRRAFGPQADIQAYSTDL